MTLRNHAVTALVCLVAAGCFRQVPLETAAPAPATRVIATLTDSGTVAMGNALGAGAMEVEGVVTAATESQWTLQMIRVEHRGGRSVEWNREPVPFARTILTNPTMVKLDRKRTWLAAGAIVAGAILLANSLDLIGGDESPPDDDVPQAIVVPRFSGGRR